MAVILAMTYQKKLGLPNYSSHSCSVSLTVEIPDVNAAAEESVKLYQLLQSAVDQEIQQVGYMPDATTYGMVQPTNGNAVNGHAANGHSTNGYRVNGHGANGRRLNGHSAPEPASRQSEEWNCTDGQKGLILRVVNESRLDKGKVEAMAQQMFGLGVKQLDKLQASQLIEELLEKSGKKPAGQRRWSRQPARS